MAVKYGNVFQPTTQQIERFWQNVNICSVNKCWHWSGKNWVGGYGRFFYRIENRQHHILAHRLSYFLFYKINPVGKCVLHQCDNPKCVNPNHLFLGTHQDNMKDRNQKGRSSAVSGQVWHETHKNKKGEQLTQAKLTDEAVREIRKLHGGGIKQRRIAEKFKVAEQTVYKILRGKTWCHVK
jgi:hypothetical protein